jgi:hypothetical protein
VTSPKSGWVEVVVGSWLVFLLDLAVQRRIDHRYLHQCRGRFDLTIVVLTFPIYLIPWDLRWFGDPVARTARPRRTGAARCGGS